MRTTLAVVAVLLAFSQTTWAEDLPLNEVVEGSTSSSDRATYQFEAEGAGALTVVLRTTDGSDVAIIVADDVGQPLPDARIDIDYNQNTGAEQGVIPIPRPGTYQVIVEPLGNQGEFVLAASWLPFDALERPEDSDGSPAAATLLALGERIEDSLNSADDAADWFRVDVEADGELIVTTRADSGDLIIESFAENSYTEPLSRSDQDIRGSAGRETISLDVLEGETYFLKVSSYGGRISYEIRPALIED